MFQVLLNSLHPHILKIVSLSLYLPSRRFRYFKCYKKTLSCCSLPPFSPLVMLSDPFILVSSYSMCPHAIRVYSILGRNFYPQHSLSIPVLAMRSPSSLSEEKEEGFLLFFGSKGSTSHIFTILILHPGSITYV